MSRLNSFLLGVKVLDLSQYFPGPLASLILADMGADVLKIEPPEGDEMLRVGPRGPHGEPVFYRAANAGKQVRRMDLKRSDLRDEFVELARGADVLIEGFRPGVMRRLGIDFPILKKINPGLIYCSMSGYGADGPLSQSAGHDGNYLALAGIIDRNGDDKPTVFDPPVADATSALFAVTAILGALNARARDGCGCEIDLAIADVVMPLQLLQLASYGVNGHIPRRNETYLNGGAAYYQVYRTKDDRHVMLGAIEPKFWKIFCERAERREWVTRQSEPTPQQDLISDVAAFLSKLSLAECVERFFGDCCLTPVLDLGEAVHSQHHSDRRLVRRSADGSFEALFPAWINGEPPEQRSPVELTPGSEGSAKLTGVMWR